MSSLQPGTVWILVLEEVARCWTEVGCSGLVLVAETHRETEIQNGRAAVRMHVDVPLLEDLLFLMKLCLDLSHLYGQFVSGAVFSPGRLQELFHCTVIWSQDRELAVSLLLPEVIVSASGCVSSEFERLYNIDSLSTVLNITSHLINCYRQLGFVFMTVVSK